MPASAWRRLGAPILLAAVLAASLAAPAIAQTGDDVSVLNQEVAKLIAAGKPAEAVPLAERAVVATEARHGRDAAETGTALAALAGALLQAKRIGEAEPLLRRSLAIAEAAHNHDDVAVLLG